MPNLFKKKSQANLKITIIGDLTEKPGKPNNERRKLVLMDNFLNQEATDHAFIEPHRSFVLKASPKKSVLFTLTATNDLAIPELVKSVCYGSQCVIIAYDRFNQESICKQADMVKEALPKGATVMLVGLKQKGEFLSPAEEALAGFVKAHAFAIDNKWQHRVVTLNETTEVNELFTEIVTQQLSKMKLEAKEVAATQQALAFTLAQQHSPSLT